MGTYWLRGLILSAALVFCSAAEEARQFQLRDGDTVVFYGDSITNQRLYTVFAETYVTTRFPRLGIHFVHSGWSGDRVTGGLGGDIDVRLDRDVFAYNPTVITILLGMNDAGYRPFNQAIFNIFANGYRHILERIKTAAPQARVTLLAPSPYDDVTRPPGFADGYNAVLLRYGQFVGELGRANDLTVADLNAPVFQLLKAAEASRPQQAERLVPDRVHPAMGVHLVMAEALLQAWQAPAVVSTVEIDGTTGTLTRAENTVIDSIARARSLEWTQTDRALPMPLDRDEETIGLALGHSDFMDALNREMLTISGLPAGRYGLRIDGEAVGEFNAPELAQGINLAAVRTPMSRQAQAVYEMIVRRNYLRWARMMAVENSFKEYHPAKLGAALEALRSLEDEVLSLERARALPKLHRYQLVPLALGPGGYPIVSSPEPGG